ncbi:hypothetical protein RHMOL_Rhmol04G0350100 [Rhododendron molle]|uniref:Uncharacterized protein n=1 Tax=Rhododendron molle TaxID=49168 RepID=A0ACC0P7T0_RHOML|nr:hypothetical protein RHMOL_Rhmol04G0350100 [Rhododendron molle]
MAPLSPTPTSSPPPESSTVDPFPPVSPISTASSPPSSPRTATDLSQPGSPKRMDDGGLEEQEIDWSKDYPLGFGMKFDIETAAREKSKWSVKNFEEKHNHILHIPETVYKMRSQRKIHEAQALNIAIAVDSGLSLKASHDLISAQDVPIPYIPDMINCGSNSQSAPSSSEMKLVNYGLNGSFFGIMNDFILGMQGWKVG